MSIIYTALLSSCEKQENSDESIEELFRSNVSFSQNENLSGYMSTIDPSSPMRDQTESVVSKLFSTHDLSYKLDSVEIVSKTSTRAVVKVTQTTKKIAGPEFRDHVVVTINELRKISGQWKIFSSNIEKIDYLKSKD